MLALLAAVPSDLHSVLVVGAFAQNCGQRPPAAAGRGRSGNAAREFGAASAVDGNFRLLPGRSSGIPRNSLREIDEGRLDGSCALNKRLLLVTCVLHHFFT